MKAQLSTEFIVILGVLSMLFVLILLVFSSRFSDVTYEKERVVAQHVADSVAHRAVLTGVHTQGNITYYFPARIVGKNYTLQFTNYSVVLNWSNHLVTSPVGVLFNSTMDATAFAGTQRTFLFTHGVVSIV